MKEMLKNWYAVYTKPRWEKKVNQLLINKQIESWCPLQKVERQWSDRRKVIEEPLFKSYVFVRIDLENRVEVLQTDGVLNFVYHVGKPAVIREKDIELIKSFLQEKQAVIRTQDWETLEPDMKVKVQHGLFMDTIGTVIRTGKKRIYVRLESLGQVMIVEFPKDYVTALT